MKKLSTHCVNVGGEFVEGLLQNCPHLQQLSLSGWEISRLSARSRRSNSSRSPCATISNHSSIVCLMMYMGMRIHSEAEEDLRNFCSGIELSNLKELVVVDEDRGDQLDRPLTPLIHLMNASPRLEKFVRKSAQFCDDWEYGRKSKEEIPIWRRERKSVPRAGRKMARARLAARKTPTSYPRLKEVEWVGYVDVNSYLELLMHLVGNGAALENIVVDQRDLVFQVDGWWDFYPPLKTKNKKINWTV